MDLYLRGVVPLEMPARCGSAAGGPGPSGRGPEAYAAYERAHPRAGHYQICDTTSCQVYGGYDAEHPATNDAITGTAQPGAAAGGEPAFTQFSSSSGGWTSAGSRPYLPGPGGPVRRLGREPGARLAVSFTDNAFERRFPRIGNLRRLVVLRRDGNGQWGGRVTSLRVVGSKDTVTVSGDTARSTLGLRSTWFTFRIR